MKKILLFFIALSFAFLTQAQTGDIAIATQLVTKHSAEIGMDENALANYVVSSSYNSDGTQLVYLQQTYKRIPVFNTMLVLAFKNDAVVSNAGSFISDMDKRANAAQPAVTSDNAVRVAFAEAKLTTPASLQRKKISDLKWTYGVLPGVSEEVTAELVWLPAQDGKSNKVSLVWQVQVVPVRTADWWSIHVDASAGMVINKLNYTVYEKFGHHENQIPEYLLAPQKNSDVAASINNNLNTASAQSPALVSTANYLVIPFPAESPVHPGGTAAVRTNPWTNAPGNASSLGWHNDGTTDYTITRGNNVWATEDRAATNTNSGISTPTGQPATSSTTPDPLNFNFPPTYNTDPVRTNNQRFAITNLFYWNNLMHDVMYQYGFTEPAGNFQANNQGRGGAQNDYVIAVGQSNVSTDNANFATPADGGRPRMRMYLFQPVTAPVLNQNAPSVTTYPMVESNFGDPTNANGPVPAKNLLGDTGPITGDVVYYNDAAGTHEACSGPPTNSLTGKIALIDRGNCNFTVKIHAAQDAGAIAVIMVNNIPDAPNIMGGGPDYTITIPAVMISQANGAILAAQLGSGLNVTLNGAPRLDGDLDAGVMCHEFTHGISNRLTGGPTVPSCLSNAEQGGEGWSDYAGLMMTTNWATATVSDGAIPREVGTYVLNGTAAGDGFRNYPYTTNFALNPLTYANMGVAPIGTEVHNTGEIWCMAIWEMTWAIIQQENSINPNLYDYTAAGNGGNSIALKLVLEGMKLQPCGPGFIDARNAILAADRNLYAGRHACAIWTAFAKRGMGYGASQGSASSATDQTATTAMPPAPGITTQPGSTSVAAGANASFNVVTDITTNTIYTWQVSTDGGTTWNNVTPSVITATLNLTAVTCAMNGYKYRAVIGIGCATTTSAVVTLTVTGCSTAPTISSQPANTAACAGSNATFSVTAAGTGLTYSWEVSTNGGTSWTAVTPAATTATLTLTGVTTTMNNNQYRVIVTSGTQSTTSSVAVLTVTAVPAAPTVTTPVAYCQGATATPLTATGTGLLWYTASTGGTGSATAPTPSTTTAGTTTYYVSQTTGTCESPRAAIVVNVTAAPAAPTVTTPVAYCQGATATALTATGTGLLWYTAATGGTGSATAPTPSTTAAGTTTYYVSQTTGSCESPRVAIVVNVTATPAAPTATSPVTYCQNTTAVPLTATGTGLLWYTAPTGGTGTATAPTPSTTATGSTTYYVTQTTTCGESPRTAVVVNITAPPAAPTVTSPVALCQGATATPLTATGTALLWYTASTGGTGSATAPTPSTTATGSTTYYVSQTIGCESPRAALVVNVNATPGAPAVTTPLSYCQNATAPALTATGTNLLWYTAATGGTGSATAITPSTTTAGSTTYYVSQTTGTCEGPRAAIVVNITAAATAPTVTTPVTYCQGAAATPLTATGTGLLWYTAPTGGTGSATAPTPVTGTAGNTTYYVSQTTACGEGPRAAIVVTVAAPPAAPTVTTPVVYCQGATATPLTATGTALLWYTAPTGGTGSTTAPTPSTTTVGSTTYYVSQTTGTCEGARAAIVVTVNATPGAPTATSPVTYCQGATAVALTATGTNLKWYTAATGGTGSASAPVPVTTTAGTTTYYVSQTTGTCEGPRAAVVVNVTAGPSITSQPANVTTCSTSATFSVTATGTAVTYQWQLSTDGGTTYNNIAGATNSTLVINNLTAAMANYRYRVVISAGSCGNVISNSVTARVGTTPVVVLTAAAPAGNPNSTNPAYPSGLYTTVSPVGNYTYQWTRNGIIIPNGFPYIAPVNGIFDDFGTYQVTVFDVATGCPGVSNTVTVSDIPGMRNRLFISPNPTRDIVNIRYYSSTTEAQPRTVNVYDGKGAKVITSAFTTSAGTYGRMVLDLSALPKGVYMVDLRDVKGKKVASDQIIKL